MCVCVQGGWGREVGVAIARSARLFALNSHFLTPFAVRQLHEQPQRGTDSQKPKTK